MDVQKDLIIKERPQGSEDSEPHIAGVTQKDTVWVRLCYQVGGPCQEIRALLLAFFNYTQAALRNLLCC